LNHRKLGFAKELDHTEVAINRKRRSALTGEIAGLEFLVRIEDQLLLAVFGTEVDANAVLGPGELDAIVAKCTGEVGVDDLFRRAAMDHTKDVEVVDRRLRRRRAEDVIGDAVRV